MRNVKERLYELEKTVDESITKTQITSRKAILDKILTHLKASGDSNDHLYASLIRDWPCFLAWEFDTLEGVPLFLSPWQIRANFLAPKYNNIFVNCCRQSGKTTWEATEALRLMVTERNTAVLSIAPTQEQLVVRDNFRNMVRQSEFIQENFLLMESGGVDSQELIRFGQNGSSFKPLNLSGDVKRGKTANAIMIDEFQLLDRDKYVSVVQPMLSSAFTKRRFYRFMTPSDLYRPDLSEIWQESVNSDETLTIEVNTWQALDEGIKKPTKEMGAGSMQETFEDFRLSCPYVETCGACPGFVPTWFDGPPRECLGCFTDSPEFLQEYMATFPKKADQFFRSDWLHEARLTNEPLLSPYQIGKMPEQKVVGIDLGGLADPTEIVVNVMSLDDGYPMFETVGRVQISPVGGKSGDSLFSVTDKIKTVVADIRPTMIVMDVTRKEHYAKALVTGDDAIPKGIIATNPPAENHGLRGIWFTGEQKARFYLNHQQMLAEQRVKVRGKEEAFWEDYYFQHVRTRQHQTSKATYPRFKTPKNDHLLDAAANASAPAILGVKGGDVYDFHVVNLE